MTRPGADQEGVARRAAERAARDSYGRLVALLAARSRDVSGAEDALSEAFRSALQTWPVGGVPDRPEAWLLVAARRAMGHSRRHAAVAEGAQATLLLLADEQEAAEPAAIPDERLRLLFACAHPAIEASVQAPLMLQTVLGLDAAAIAASFLTSPAAMGQRLVRAKARIREAGLSFILPEPADLPARLDAVLAAIYATYGTGWEDVLGADPRRKGLADEALWLSRVLAGLLPDAAEAQGLLALMLYCEARREARRDGAGRFVPLDRQDPERWSRPLVAEAEAVLRAAARTATPGRFQIEAAIQSVHVERLLTGRAPMPVLATLYELLAQVSPTIGVLVARAAAVAETGDPARALELLDAIAGKARDYQPWWAARGRIAALLGRGDLARAALLTAAGLSEDTAVRAFLIGQATRIEAKPHPAPSMSDS